MPDTTLDRRLGDWIDTRGGPVWSADFRPEDVNIAVIAEALSNIPRFGGHLKPRCWYSVAQHSVLCARLAPPDLALEALLHDAHEAILGADLPSPVKRMIPGFREFESRIDRAIRARFRLPLSISPIVRLIDEQMLVTEAAQVSSGTTGWWARDDYPRPFDLRISAWPPERACFEFLALYRHLVSDLPPAEAAAA